MFHVEIRAPEYEAAKERLNKTAVLEGSMRTYGRKFDSETGKSGPSTRDANVDLAQRDGELRYKNEVLRHED